MNKQVYGSAIEHWHMGKRVEKHTRVLPSTDATLHSIDGASEPARSSRHTAIRAKYSVVFIRYMFRWICSHFSATVARTLSGSRSDWLHVLHTTSTKIRTLSARRVDSFIHRSDIFAVTYRVGTVYFARYSLCISFFAAYFRRTQP